MQIRLIIWIVFGSFNAFGQIKSNMPKPVLIHNAFFIGAWVPTGYGSILGNHFVAGMKAGLNKGKTTCDWILELRLGKSAQDYLVSYGGSTVSTNNFLSGFTGVSFSKDIIIRPNYSWYLVGGIGIEGIETIVVNSPKFPVSQSIKSINFNVGFGRNFFNINNKRIYFSAEANFNFVNYKNEGGSPLDGNSLTIRTIFNLAHKSHFKRTLPHRVYS